jgi:hypothetical protein
VPQAVAHGPQRANGPVEFFRLGGEQMPVDTRRAVACNHLRDLVEGEPSGTPQSDQRQPFQNGRIEEAAQTSPSDGGDQSAFLIKAQCRGRQPGSLRHVRNVSHPLDLKST